MHEQPFDAQDLIKRVTENKEEARKKFAKERNLSENAKWQEIISAKPKLEKKNKKDVTAPKKEVSKDEESFEDVTDIDLLINNFQEYGLNLRSISLNLKKLIVDPESKKYAISKIDALLEEKRQLLNEKIDFDMKDMVKTKLLNDIELLKKIKHYLDSIK